MVREDTHKKVFAFSGRTTKVCVPPPQDLNGSESLFLKFFFVVLENFIKVAL